MSWHMYPTHISVKCKIISYWIRLLSSEEARLSLVMWHLCNENIYKFPWMICVEKIFNDRELSNLWINQHDHYSVNHK